jgi:hypothetical protein
MSVKGVRYTSIPWLCTILEGATDAGCLEVCG